MRRWRFIPASSARRIGARRPQAPPRAFGRTPPLLPSWDRFIESEAVNKPRPMRQLAELTSEFMADASRSRACRNELVPSWGTIVGAEIARARPSRSRLHGQRRERRRDGQPATWCLRVEGPIAIEIQHQSGVNGADPSLLRLAGGRPDRAQAGAAVAAQSQGGAAKLDDRRGVGAIHVTAVHRRGLRARSGAVGRPQSTPGRRGLTRT